MVEIGFEIEQLAFEIGGCPEQRTIQALSAEGADQPLHKWVGPRHVRHGLDFGHIQDSQVGLPSVKTIKRIVVGTEVFRHGAVASKGLVEHSAKSGAVDRAGVQAEPNDATSVLIHDDQNPVSPQHCRFAAKQVYAPETVLKVAEESQPRGTVGVRLGVVMRGQDAPNEVFIDRDAKRQSNLLSDSAAAPGEIALFGDDNRVDEFLGRTPWDRACAYVWERRAVGTSAGSAFGEGAVRSTVSERWPQGSAETAGVTERTNQRRCGPIPGD